MLPIPIVMMALGFGTTMALVSSKPKPKKLPPVGIGHSRRDMSRTYLRDLIECAQSGHEPSPRLIRHALIECLRKGRHDIATVIQQRFVEPPPPEEMEYEVDKTGGLEEDSSPEAPPEEMDFEALYHQAQQGSTEEVKKDTITVSGMSSPIAGVDNDKWCHFVDRLATDPPSFSTKKHVGKFHLRRDRLSELGFNCDGPLDEESQYAMLVSDITDAKAKSDDLIRKHIASTVIIDGQEHTVTLSGLLGLLKAAGVSNARSWLERDGDRTQFPSTTSIFLSTNGVF